MTETCPPVHLRLRGEINETTQRLALRAALTASHLLGLATGTHLRRLRALHDPLASLQARLEEAELRARLAWEAAEILRTRFAKIPERHRPYIAAAFDAFSRLPLAVETFRTRPAANDMASLLRAAARTLGKPKYLITDQGGEFSGRAFARSVRRQGAVHRFAATGSLLATARLERFWRTLKESAGLYRLQLPLTLRDLELRLQPALLHYICFRPHEGLRGAVPGEAFSGLDPVHREAVDPPRGRPGEGPRHIPFDVELLDPRNRRFPILKPAA